MPIPVQAVAHEMLRRIIARTTFPPDEESDACWTTDFYSSDKARPQVAVWGRNYAVHRVAHLAINQDDPLTPAKPQVNHRCGNASCWNPAHLYAGNQSRNTKDAIRHGTWVNPAPNGPGVGEDVYQAKLTWPIVREIRDRWAAGGVTQAAMALEYGVSAATVSHIICNRKWKESA